MTTLWTPKPAVSLLADLERVREVLSFPFQTIHEMPAGWYRPTPEDRTRDLIADWWPARGLKPVGRVESRVSIR